MAKPAVRAASIVKQLHGAFCRGATQQDLLELAVNKIHEAGQPSSSVYLYTLDADSTMELAAFNGRLPQRKGSPANGDTSAQTVSVLIRRNEEILGRIDVASGIPAGLEEAERTAIAQIADALASLL